MQEILNIANSLIKQIHKKDQSATGKPLVIASWAQSMDGYLGYQEERTDLSCKESLIMTHSLRASCDAILVGINTVLHDNPRLNVRLDEVCGSNEAGSIERRNDHPVAVILDSKLRIPEDSFLARHRNPIIFTSATFSNDNDVLKQKYDLLLSLGCRIIPVKPLQSDSSKLDINEVLRVLYSDFAIKSVMVEGGVSVLSSFIAQDICDYILLTVCPAFLGEGNRISFERKHRASFSIMQKARFGKDVVLLMQKPLV